MEPTGRREAPPDDKLRAIRDPVPALRCASCGLQAAAPLRFCSSLQDPELLAEAARMQLAVAAITGEQVQALIRQVYATPKDVVAKAAVAGAGKGR
jgi:hypothetical protein